MTQAETDSIIQSWRRLQTFCAVFAVLEALMFLPLQRVPLLNLAFFCFMPAIYFYAKRGERQRREWLAKWADRPDR